MNRKERKELAEKKINDSLFLIADFIQREYEKTEDWERSMMSADKYIRLQQKKNPQESHIWEKAAFRYRESLEKEIKKEMLEE